jgi:hypothetical protein
LEFYLGAYKDINSIAKRMIIAQNIISQTNDMIDDVYFDLTNYDRDEGEFVFYIAKLSPYNRCNKLHIKGGMLIDKDNDASRSNTISNITHLQFTDTIIYHFHLQQNIDACCPYLKFLEFHECHFNDFPFATIVELPNSAIDTLVLIEKGPVIDDGGLVYSQSEVVLMSITSVDQAF